MKRVLGLGHALVDLLYQMPDDNLLKEFKLPKGSMQLIDEKNADELEAFLRGKDISLVSGGSAANSIHGLARLGINCGYVGTVFKDDLGDFYRNDLQAAGIDTILFEGKSKTGRANTFISPDSERTFATYLGASSEINIEDITEKTFEGYDIFHIEGYQVYNTPLIDHSIKLAKSLGLKVSIDMASFNVVEDNLVFLKEAIPAYVDIVFANEEEAKAYTGKEPGEALNIIAEQCKIAVVKVGKNGSLIKNGDTIYTVGAVPCNPLDTTGAGDQYAAGFLYGYIQGLSFDKCGQIGALIAGRVIEKYGARIQEQDWPELLEKVGEIVG
ncbi:MAG TPA: adenosine kinase [Bacteroidales bacterium]|nr:adenosine kinase [Bacteroidales bacterium]